MEFLSHPSGHLFRRNFVSVFLKRFLKSIQQSDDVPFFARNLLLLSVFKSIHLIDITELGSFFR